MPSPKQTYDPPSAPPSLGVKEEQVEYGFIGKLQGLKYEYRPDIRDRAALESLTTPADAQVEAELNAQEDTLGKRWNV